jgi:hypothetical protein
MSMLNSRLLWGAVALGLTLASGQVMAQGYLGLSAGQGQLDVKCDGLPNCSKGSMGGKVYGGYQWELGNSQSWGLEAGLYSFGKASASDSSARVQARAEALAATVNYKLDMSPQVWGLARLGVARTELRQTDTVGSVSVSDTQYSTQALAGVEFGWRFHPDFSLHAGGDFSRARANDITRNVQLWSVGLRFDF